MLDYLFQFIRFAIEHPLEVVLYAFLIGVSFGSLGNVVLTLFRR